MVYKYLSLHFNSVKDVADLRIPIDVFKSIVEESGALISSFNFNKYYGYKSTGPYLTDQGALRINPDGTIAMKKEIAQARIEARFNFDEENENRIFEIIAQIAEQEKKNKLIRDYDKAFIGVWVEPDFVKKAHELGTKWAFELRSWIEQNTDIFNNFRDPERGQQRKAGFMAQLTHLILLRAELNSHLDWSALRESPTYEKNKQKHEERLIALAETFGKRLNEGFKGLERQVIPSFLERLFHAFFNCTYSDVEETILNWQLTGLFWKSLGDAMSDFRKI